MYQFSCRNVNDGLVSLARALKYQGTVRTSRGGDVIELLDVHVTLNRPWDREILLPERRASLPAQIAETAWVLNGDPDIRWLTRYLPRAPEFSSDGRTWRAAYGHRLRFWGNGDRTTDQLNYVVNTLTNDPDSRQAVMSIWDPAVDTTPDKDIPCNNWLHFLIRDGRLHTYVAVRSNDLIWGWSGINTFEWSVLHEMLAWVLGVEMGPITYNISSLHVYERHWDRLNCLAATNIPWENEMDGRTDFADSDGRRFNPDLDTCDRSLYSIYRLVSDFLWAESVIRDFAEGGTRLASDVHRAINEFPDPMMRDWLRGLAYHLTGRQEGWLKDVAPRTATALRLSAKPKSQTVNPQSAAETPPSVTSPSDFACFVAELHEGKHEVYGDSWKRRGEMIGIMANIARKVDRLGVAGGGDTAADTAIDLMCYLTKYRLWLVENTGAPLPDSVTPRSTEDYTDHAQPVSQLVDYLDRSTGDSDLDNRAVETRLASQFDLLEGLVTRQAADRYTIVDAMLTYATVLARRLWTVEQSADESDGGEYLGADHE